MMATVRDCSRSAPRSAARPDPSAPEARDAPRCAGQGVHARRRLALRLPHGGAGSRTWRASLLVACLAAVFSHSDAATFSCTTPGTVCNALADLYSATNGNAWSTNEGWATAARGTPSNYCNNWYGVTCDSGLVTVLCVHPRARLNGRV